MAGFGAIPMIEIKAYADYLRINDDESREALFRVVRILDTLWAEEYRRKNEGKE
jgi:hypothetical protein